MNYLLKTITPFIMAITVLSSCSFKEKIKGSKEIVTTKLNLKNFDQIYVSKAIEVEIHQANDFNVVIECNQNIEDKLDLQVERETLKIDLINSYNYSNSTVLVKVHLPVLKKISASGASKVTIPNFVSENLEMDIAGATNIKGQLKISNNLYIEASGASQLLLNGTANHTQLSFSGASNFHGKNLIINTLLDVSGSGASKIESTVNGPINIELSGASHFSYYGNGSIQHQNTSGASVISKK